MYSQENHSILNGDLEIQILLEVTHDNLIHIC